MPSASSGLFTDRRPYGTVPGIAGYRRARHRHLLRGGALSLRDGRRRAHGVTSVGMHFWWPKISGRMYPEGWATIGCIDRIHRLQSLHSSRSSCWATSVCRAATGSTRSEYQVLNMLSTARGHHPGRGIPSAHDLLHVVDALWQSRQLIIRGALPVLSG